MNMKNINIEELLEWISNNYQANGRKGCWDSLELNDKGEPIHLIDSHEKLINKYLQSKEIEIKYYSNEITKQDFLDKVKSLMKNKDFPYKLDKISPIIYKDLSILNFDWENYTSFKETNGFGYNNKYPVNYRELEDNFHVFFVNAGGDWEIPICFCFYWDGTELRAYITINGNCFNKKENVLYNNNDIENINAEDIISEKNIIVDILTYIKLKI